jgi:hypothetical protein
MKIAVCGIQGCDRVERLQRGMCQAHYMRFKRGARGEQMTAPIKPRDSEMPRELKGVAKR